MGAVSSSGGQALASPDQLKAVNNLKNNVPSEGIPSMKEIWVAKSVMNNAEGSKNEMSDVFEYGNTTKTKRSSSSTESGFDELRFLAMASRPVILQVRVIENSVNKATICEQNSNSSSEKKKEVSPVSWVTPTFTDKDVEKLMGIDGLELRQFEISGAFTFSDRALDLLSRHGALESIILSHYCPRRRHSVTNTTSFAAIDESNNPQLVEKVASPPTIKEGRPSSKSVFSRPVRSSTAPTGQINSCYITDAGMSCLKRLKKLREVDFTGVCGKLTDVSLSMLCTMSSLLRLHLLGAKFSPSALRSLKKLKNLESLHLSGLTDQHLEYLIKCKQVHHIWLHSSDKITLKGFKTLSALSPAVLAVLHCGGELTKTPCWPSNEIKKFFPPHVFEIQALPLGYKIKNRFGDELYGA